MLRTITFFTKFGLHLVSTIHTSYHYNKLGKDGKVEEQARFLNEAAKGWGQYLVERTKTDVEVFGKENIPEGPCLIISNHQSNFDIPILAGYLDKPIGFIAKIELANIPIISKWMKRIHCIFIDRDNPRQAIKALATAAESLKDGNSLVIFPEGTRSKGPNMGEFKKGSLRLAEKSGVPIVPITLIDSHKIYEGNNNRIRSANVKVIVEEPIYLEQLTKEQKETLLEDIKIRIQNNLNKYNLN